MSNLTQNQKIIIIVVVVLLFCCCCALIVPAVLGPSMESVFSDIVSGLETQQP
jgi:hypothetical protein